MQPTGLCALGHIATRQDLELAGLTRPEIDAIARSELIVHVRKGLYACRHLTDSERIATEVGGRLDCITVLSRHKIWVGNEKGLHLRMPPKAGSHTLDRLNKVLAEFASARFRLLGSRHISVHWAACAPPERGARLEVPIVAALRQAMDCLPPDDIVAALESALHLKKITSSELDQLIIEAPLRLQSVLAQVTPGAQSGYETKARLGFQRLGHTVEIQVAVPGVGHIDTLIDGVVNLEIDGRETHEGTFEEDRDRDVGTELCGIRSLRIPAAWIDTRWSRVVAAVETMIRGAQAAESTKRRRTRAENRRKTPRKRR